MTERYSHGWTDPRSIYGTTVIIRRYGKEYKMENKFETQDYSVEINLEEHEKAHEQYTKMLGASMQQTMQKALEVLFANTYAKWRKSYSKLDDRGKQMKVDAHEYITEAKNLPIETCEALWITKYGNEPLVAMAINGQDELMWEIGNKLFWAGKIVHDDKADTYSCK